jgi:hypothetical protein
MPCAAVTAFMVLCMLATGCDAVAVLCDAMNGSYRNSMQKTSELN